MATFARELEQRLERLESRVRPQHRNTTVRLELTPDSSPTVVGRDVERAVLKQHAERLLSPEAEVERKIGKRGFTSAEVETLRAAQAAGVLPPNMPPTRVEVREDGRAPRTETFAGEHFQDAIWQQFTTPNLRIGRFRKPDAAELAASRVASRDWWEA